MLFTENMKNEISLIIDEDKEKYFNSLEKTIEQSYDNIKRKYLTKNPFSFCINYFKKE